MEESSTPVTEKKKEQPNERFKSKENIRDDKDEDESEESDESGVDTNDNDKSSEDDTHKSHDDDDDQVRWLKLVLRIAYKKKAFQEWEKFQKLHDREKSLEGKSKTSHSVHCPYFPYDKQEYWWTYICDRKSKTLLTAPYFVTGLVEKEIIHLKVT